MNELIVAGLGQCSWDTLFFVDEAPEPDEKHEVRGVTEQGGGPVATALVALSKLGLRTRFAGVAGDDEAGRSIMRSLEAEGVDPSGLVLREGRESQKAFIAVEKDGGRRTIFWQRPTGDELAPSEIPEGFLDGVSLLMLDGLMPEASMHLARDSGIPVVLDAGRLRPGMLGLAALCGHVVGSERFGRDLLMDPERPEGFLDKAIELFPQGLTITLGARGCVHFSEEGCLRVPAFEVNAVDTTGAGDVFHAGYAFGLLSGLDMHERLVFASAAAALSTRGLGGRGALPSLEEVTAMINK